MEGFRSLREGESVEFVTEIAPDGRQKAIKVTGPAGASPQVSCGCRECLPALSLVCYDMVRPCSTLVKDTFSAAEVLKLAQQTGKAAGPSAAGLSSSLVLFCITEKFLI